MSEPQEHSGECVLSAPLVKGKLITGEGGVTTNTELVLMDKPHGWKLCEPPHPIGWNRHERKSQ